MQIKGSMNILLLVVNYTGFDVSVCRFPGSYKKYVVIVICSTILGKE